MLASMTRGVITSQRGAPPGPRCRRPCSGVQSTVGSGSLVRSLVASVFKEGLGCSFLLLHPSLNATPAGGSTPRRLSRDVCCLFTANFCNDAHGRAAPRARPQKCKGSWRALRQKSRSSSRLCRSTCSVAWPRCSTCEALRDSQQLAPHSVPPHKASCVTHCSQ